MSFWQFEWFLFFVSFYSENWELEWYFPAKIDPDTEINPFDTEDQVKTRTKN